MRFFLVLHFDFFFKKNPTVGRLKEKNVKTESLAGRNCVICVHLREEDLQSHYK
jgi:hypothetical protein